MVFPRKAGFSRCYLVSPRHEILSNIDRNLTGTRLQLRKNRNKTDKFRKSANLIPVLLLSFESQTVVFQLFDFHLGKFKMFIIKEVLLSQMGANRFNLTMATCWRFSKRTIGQARIHTGFHPFIEIGRTFHNKNAFQVEIWKMLDSPWLISTTIWKLTLVK